MDATGPRARLNPKQEHVQISIEKFDYEAQISGLRSDVARIKQLAYAIEDEGKLQGADISALDESMEKARLMLSKARRRLNLVYKQSRSNLMLYVVLFATGVFIVVYVLKKLYRLGRWIV